MLTVAQTTKNISNFMVGKSSLQEIAPLAVISAISDSNHDARNYSPNNGETRKIGAN